MSDKFSPASEAKFDQISKVILRRTHFLARLR